MAPFVYFIHADISRFIYSFYYYYSCSLTFFFAFYLPFFIVKFLFLYQLQ